MANADAEITAEVERSLALNREGRSDEALAVVEALVARHPDDPRVHFEHAGALDYQGREADAVAPYRRAQELGLTGDALPRLYVQLGSTLRNLARSPEAAELLREGRQRFPEYAAIRAFLALALVSAGRGPEAVVELLDLILDHSDAIGLDGYQRALGEYAAELRPPDVS